jgi:hypothetical protein
MGVGKRMSAPVVPLNKSIWRVDYRSVIDKLNHAMRRSPCLISIGQALAKNAHSPEIKADRRNDNIFLVPQSPITGESRILKKYGRRN